MAMRTNYGLTIHASDGISAFVCRTLAAAFKKWAVQTGREITPNEALRLAKHWKVAVYDADRRRITITRLPAGINTAAQYMAFLRACDARECGEATHAQIKLLRQLEYGIPPWL